MRGRVGAFWFHDVKKRSGPQYPHRVTIARAQDTITATHLKDGPCTIASTTLPDATLGLLKKRGVSLVGEIAFRLDERHRSRCLNNLAYLYPGESPESRWEMAQAIFHHGALCTEEFLSAIARKRAISNLFDVRNATYLQEAISAGRGVIGLTAHFGNPSLIPFLLSQFISRQAIFMRLSNFRRRSPANMYRQFRARQLERSTSSTILTSDMVGTRQAISHLQHREFVSVLADLVWGSAAVPVKIIGREVTVSRLPSWLARVTGSLLIPYFTHRTDIGTHLVSFYEPICFDGVLSSEAADQTLMERYAALLSPYIDSWPAQWQWPYSYSAAST